MPQFNDSGDLELEIVDSNTGKELSFSFNNVLDAHLVFKSEMLSGKK